MMNKCSGCGINIDSNNAYCNRCFKIKNYNLLIDRDVDGFDYKFKDNYLEVYMLDVLNLPSKLDLDREALFVINKRDLFPDVSDERIINYVSSYNINYLDIIVVSSFDNYNLDYLYNKIKEYKKKYIYFTGNSNVGKSSLINKLLYNYGSCDSNILVSNYPNITSANIEVKLNNMILVDTPSEKDNSILSKMNSKFIKKFTPVKLKQIVYQYHDSSIYNLEDIISVDCRSNIIFNFNNQVSIKKSKKVISGCKYEFDMKSGYDLVIEGIGYIRTTDMCKVIITTYEGINIYMRKSMGD